MRVEVYFNTRRGLFSVRALEGPNKGKVIEHVRHVPALKDVRFVVHEAGRKRVLREKRKNVHAFVRGRIPDDDERFVLTSDTHEVGYNPYKDVTFMDRTLNAPIYSSDLVQLAVVGDRPMIWARVV